MHLDGDCRLRTAGQQHAPLEYILPPPRALCCRWPPVPSIQRSRFEAGIYLGPVLDLSSLDLEEIADALADQTDYEHRWLINPQTGEVVFSTADTGIDGQTPADPDESDLIGIDPVPSRIWYQDGADFAEVIIDERAGRRLARAIQGGGASAGSKTSSMSSIRSCCWRGTPSAMPAPGAASSSGLRATHSSRTRQPSASWPPIQVQTYHELR